MCRVRGRRGLVVPPAAVRAVRARRLLRHVAVTTRQRARPCQRAPGDPKFRAGRDLVLQLSDQRVLRAGTAACAAGAPSRRPDRPWPGRPCTEGLAGAPALTVPSGMTLEEARERARRAAHLNAFLCFTDEHGPGPAVAVKDLIDVRGVPTTGGGVILPRVPAAADAPVITRIRAGGCGVVGKTNLHEWAYGASSRNPHYGDVLNPGLPGRSAGGSSSGSAAAVAAGLCDWAIGTDTAGSVRIPASLCGIVGFRPTYGSIPTGNVIPLARSLDTVGALAPSVEAAADAVALMAGWPGRFRAVGGTAST